MSVARNGLPALAFLALGAALPGYAADMSAVIADMFASRAADFGKPELASDEAFIVQNGAGNTATIDQTSHTAGLGHYAEINQMGADNRAAVVQTGESNRLRINQMGTGNAAQATQDGARNSMDLKQTGDGNSFVATQIGNDNNIVAQQAGYVGLTLSEIGNNNSISMSQTVSDSLLRATAGGTAYPDTSIGPSRGISVDIVGNGMKITIN